MSLIAGSGSRSQKYIKEIGPTSLSRPQWAEMSGPELYRSLLTIS